MTLYKKLKSGGGLIALGSGDQSGIFKTGFKFILGRTIYTVTKAFKEDNTEMRELRTDENDIEIVTVATLLRDAQARDFTVMENKDQEQDEPSKEE